MIRFTSPHHYATTASRKLLKWISQEAYVIFRE